MTKKIFAALLLAAISAGCSQSTYENIQTGALPDTPVTRGQAVKMLAMSRYSLDEINNLPRKIDLDDSYISNWCDKYINAAVTAGLIRGTQENTFLQDEMLTLEQAGFILQNAAKEKNLVLQYDTADRKKPINSKVWFQAFDSIKNNVEEKEIVILADENLCSDLKSGYVLSDKGLLNADGLKIDSSCFNRGVKAYIKDNCILAIKEISNSEPVIENALVEDISAEGVQLNIKGCRMFFYCVDKPEKDSTVNVRINGNRISEIIV